MQDRSWWTLPAAVSQHGVASWLSAPVVKETCYTVADSLPPVVWMDGLADQSGATEETIGTLLAAHPELRSKMSIATKAAPPLDRVAIREKCEASLAALQTDHVDLYYLHQPDVSIDLDETLSTMNALHEEGKFKEFGLSNFAGWEVVDIWHRCKEKGWVLPTVYQGMYNGITRDCEKHLFPALRRVGMRFVSSTR